MRSLRYFRVFLTGAVLTLTMAIAAPAALAVPPSPIGPPQAAIGRIPGLGGGTEAQSGPRWGEGRFTFRTVDTKWKELSNWESSPGRRFSR